MEASTRPYDAVIFDMDGTIFDSEELYYQAYQTALQAQGVPLSKQLYFAEFAGKTNCAVEQYVQNQWGDTINFPRFLTQWPKHLAELTADPIPLMPTIEELIQDLAVHKIPMAIGSSSNLEEIEHFSSNAGIRHFFSALAAGDEVEQGKPDPAIFLLAAERLEIAPERCIVIEDSNFGVEAGLAAGMRVVLGKTHIVPKEELLERVLYTDDPRTETLKLLGF